MANRNFNRVQALDKEIKHLYAQFTVDEGSGYPSADLQTANRSAGIKSIVATAAGKYTITLGVKGAAGVDTYPALFWIDAVLEDGTAITAGGGITLQIIEASVHDKDKGYVIIQFLDKDGAAAAVRDGDIVRLHLVLKNSNEYSVGVGNYR